MTFHFNINELVNIYKASAASFLMLEETLCEIIIQILIGFNALICRREFQTKLHVSSGFMNVSEQDYF